MTNQLIKISLNIMLLLLFISAGLQAQQLTTASGGNATGSGGSVSYSIGQVFYTSVTGGGMLITEGVQQPFQNNPLPLTLIRFDAMVANKNCVQLNWETATEINNDYFTIERSKNGTDWTAVIRVNGAGYSLNSIRYQAKDNDPYTGTSFYRLKQTDHNGVFTYSAVKSVYIGLVNNILLYPSPTTGSVTIKVSNPALKQMSYMLFNMEGKMLVQQMITINSSQLELGKLTKGTYVIKILSNNEEIKTFKIVKY